MKNTAKFTFFHIVEGKLKHAILCISILSKQIKSGLVKIKPHKLNIARITPKTCKKSYSIYSQKRLARIRDYLVFDDILKSANRYIQNKPQLLSATQTSIRPCQGQHYRHAIACLEQEFYFAPHRVWFKSDGHSLVAVKTILPILKYICLLYTSPSPRDRQKSRMPSSA